MLTTCECDSILRADLETKSESDEPSSPDPVLQAELRKRLEHTYAALSLAEGDTGGRTQEYTANVEWHADTDGEEYDFRLFAKSSQSGKRDGVHEEPQRIVLRSPSPVNGRSGFRNGGRPKKYYFTGTPSVDSVEQYRQAAVSGEELIAGLKTRWV